MMKNPYKFYSNCIFVHGYKHSALCDLFRLRYKIMPKDLAETLELLESIEPSKYSTILKEDAPDFELFIQNLKKEDYIHTTSSKLINQWPKWESDFYYPGHITCAIINIKNFTNYNIVKTIRLIASIGCESLNLVVKGDVDFKQLITLINEGSLNTSISIIDVYSDSSVYISEEIISLLKTNKRFTNLYFNKITNPETLSNIPLYNFYENLNFTNEVNLNDFKVNPLIYNESLKFNTYYHKKLIINEDGEIHI